MLKRIKGDVVSLDKFISFGFKVVSEVGIAPFELVGEVTFTSPITKRGGDIFGIIFAGSSNIIHSQLSEVSE